MSEFDPNKIKIKWQIPRPTFIPPIEEIEWPSQLHISLPTEQSELEKTLHFAAGTLTLLNEAFKNGYKRDQGWHCESKSEAATAALVDAARIYKRGVSLKTAHTEIQQEDHGEYCVEIHQSIDPQKLGGVGRLCLIDKKVYHAWEDKFARCSSIFLIDADEKTKTLNLCAEICRSINSYQPSEVMIFGGGVVADVAAFAAYLCRIPFYLVPTTLLAMADACVGGKTGVNYPPYGKNQVGAFAFPAGVLVFTEWFKTLPEREVLAGISECVKHAIISADELLLHDLLKIASERNFIRLSEKIGAIITVKAQVISRDPEEKNERAVLNLGHTLGHALESKSHYEQKSNYILHGEAVALGLLFAVILSEDFGSLNSHKAKELKQVLVRSPLIPSFDRFVSFFTKQPSFDDLLPFIELDKKNTSGNFAKSRWVLLSDRGILQKDGFTHPVDTAMLDKAYRKFIDLLKLN